MRVIHSVALYSVARIMHSIEPAVFAPMRSSSVRKSTSFRRGGRARRLEKGLKSEDGRVPIVPYGGPITNPIPT